jgi:hypothetical protein
MSRTAFQEILSRPSQEVLCFISLLLISGCAATYEVIDVIDLSPPRRVQAERHVNQVTVHWRAGSERHVEKFSGYLLFTATHSLASIPVRELPSPIVLPDTSTTYSFLSTDTVKLFIHLRSRAGTRQISLPSLPEVIVPGKPAR